MGGVWTKILTVTKDGSGTGTVASGPLGINCGSDCAEPYASDTAVTLSATPDGSSVFTGWLGACTGTEPCNLNVIGPVSVSATFAPSSVVPLKIDIDGNNAYDALTDGLILIRYLFGLTGTALTNNALGTGATRIDPALVLGHLNDIKPIFDVDGNGQADALTDGLILIRYLFGLRGPPLTAGALGPDAMRTDPASVAAYIQLLLP